MLLHAGLLLRPRLSHAGTKLRRWQRRQNGCGLLLLLHALRPAPWQRLLLLLQWGRLQELLLPYKRWLLKMLLLLLLAVWLRPHAGH